MNKTTPDAGDNIWESNTDTPEAVTAVKPHTPRANKSAGAPRAPAADAVPARSISNAEFDIDGLMTDFPTARDLERFVFDQTGVVLNLKGRANKLKYSTAMDVLNGQGVDPKFIGSDNPYLDKAEMVPEEAMKIIPPRSLDLPAKSEVQNQFFTAFVPHSDPEYHAQGRKMHMIFRKYTNNVITYEVIGPIEPRPHGEKIDKFGRSRPEIIKWVDPRTGEQLLQREDGTHTVLGRRLRAMMMTMRYNNTNQWLRYVDRDFVSFDRRAASNPWDLNT